MTITELTLALPYGIIDGTSMSGNYTDLKAWQMARELVRDIYRQSQRFPKEEIYGLTSQMRRAAVSIPSNIAEGKGRYSRRELLQFLFHARGSLSELETQIVIAQDLGFLGDRDCEELLRRSKELGRVLNGLINRFQEAPEVRV